MKSLKQFLLLSVTAVVFVIFSQCAISQQLQNKIAIDFGEVYCQSWVAGVKGGGSGLNLYIPIKSNPNNIVLDSVYFKGKGEALKQANPNLFVGRFTTKLNNKPDIIMSNEPYAEYGNKISQLQQNNPFKLEDDECVISYSENRKRKYYKISGIIKKEPLFYPSAPHKKQ